MNVNGKVRQQTPLSNSQSLGQRFAEDQVLFFGVEQSTFPHERDEMRGCVVILHCLQHGAASGFGDIAVTVSRAAGELHQGELENTGGIIDRYELFEPAAQDIGRNNHVQWAVAWLAG